MMGLGTCGGCGAAHGTAGVALSKCASCRSISYCSRICQRKHWNSGHRAECAKLKAAAALQSRDSSTATAFAKLEAAPAHQITDCPTATAFDASTTTNAGMRIYAETGRRIDERNGSWSELLPAEQSQMEHAIALLEEASNTGSVVAAYNIGAMYDLGHGVAKNRDKAARWYTRAAKKGYVIAQRTLGTMFLNGEGVRSDEALAYKWLKCAADQNDNGALYNLASMLFKGIGVEQNSKKAIQLLTKAADQGCARSQLDLGVILACEGCGQDKKKAVKLIRMAADSDDFQVCHKAAQTLEKIGKLVPRVHSSNPELPNGTRVRLGHLDRRRDLNGSTGVVEEFDHLQKRYSIKLDYDGTIVHSKGEHLTISSQAFIGSRPESGTLSSTDEELSEEEDEDEVSQSGFMATPGFTLVEAPHGCAGKATGIGEFDRLLALLEASKDLGDDSRSAKDAEELPNNPPHYGSTASGSKKDNFPHTGGTKIKAGSESGPPVGEGTIACESYRSVLESIGNGAKKWSDPHLEREMESIEKALRSAASAGHRESQSTLGTLLLHGKGGVANEKEALTWFAKAAEQGDSYAAVSLYTANCGESRVLRRNSAAAAKWLEKAARLGDRECQFKLGQNHFFGHNGFYQNHEIAMHWWIAAAEQGQCDAAFSLALAFSRGTGLGRNIEASVKWCRTAANAGHPAACTMLATMYKNGEGVEPSLEESLCWFLAGAKLGEYQAAHNTALCYLNGIGCRCDIEEAAHWANQARLIASKSSSGAIEAEALVAEISMRNKIAKAGTDDYYPSPLAQIGAFAEAVVGAAVEIFGMAGAGRGLNGSTGTIVESEDDTYQTLVFQSDLDSYCTRVKRVNIRVVLTAKDAQRARIARIEQLNQLLGDALDRDSTSLSAGEKHVISRGIIACKLEARLHDSPDAALILAKIYSRGIRQCSVSQSDAESFRWFTRAAESGSRPAQEHLGGSFLNGTGGAPRDLAAAVRWFEMAAAQGSPLAQHDLGLFFLQRTGVTEKAVELLRQAAKSGHVRSLLLLGRLNLDTDVGDHTDSAEAKPSPRIAAAKGDEGNRLKRAESQSTVSTGPEKAPTDVFPPKLIPSKATSLKRSEILSGGAIDDIDWNPEPVVRETKSGTKKKPKRSAARKKNSGKSTVRSAGTSELR